MWCSGKAISFFALQVLVLALLEWTVIADDCFIEGPSEGVEPLGEVHIVNVEKQDSIDLNLTCKCSVNSPKWDLYNLVTKETQTYYSPVGCTDNGQDCSPMSYIHTSNQAPGLYLHLTKAFHLNSSAILMCYSRGERKVLMVNFEEQNSMTSELPTSTPPSPPPIIVVTSTIFITTTVIKTATAEINILETSTTYNNIDEVDTILSKVSTPTLALVPIVMILAVVLVILTGCVIAMRLKYKETSAGLRKQIDELEGSMQGFMSEYDVIDDERRASNMSKPIENQYASVKLQLTLPNAYTGSTSLV